MPLTKIDGARLRLKRANEIVFAFEQHLKSPPKQGSFWRDSKAVLDALNRYKSRANGIKQEFLTLTSCESHSPDPDPGRSASTVNPIDTTSC